MFLVSTPLLPKYDTVQSTREQSVNRIFHFILNSRNVLDVARGFIGEIFCTHPSSSSSPLSLVRPLCAPTMMIIQKLLLVL